jgi:hypothetical protein
MQAKSPKPRNTKDLGRCQHTNGNGRCRMPAAGRSGLCFEHARVLRDDIDHSAVLTRFSRGFQTVEGINFALGDLYVLLAQGRISPRRAAVLTFMASQLLRTLVLMRENHGKFIHRPIGAAEFPRKSDYLTLDPEPDPAPAAADELDESHKHRSEPATPNEAELDEANGQAELDEANGKVELVEPSKNDAGGHHQPGETIEARTPERRDASAEDNAVPPGMTPLPATREAFLAAVDKAKAEADAAELQLAAPPGSTAPSPQTRSD